MVIECSCIHVITLYVFSDSTRKDQNTEIYPVDNSKGNKSINESTNYSINQSTIRNRLINLYRTIYRSNIKAITG